MSQAVLEYRFKLVLGYLVIMSMIAMFVQTMYKDYISNVLRLVFTEDYSYLLVSILTVMFVLYLSLRYMGFAYEIQISRVITSMFLMVLSMILRESSFIFPEYQVFLAGTGFSVLVIALLILVFKPVTISDIIPVLTPLLMIPIPASLFDFLTPILSRLIGRLATIITGTRFVETGVFAMIEVETAMGTYSFSVEAACSGMLTISSVIAVFPLLAYYVTVTPEKTTKKIAISLLALVSGLVIGIVGNLARVVLIVLTAKYYDVDLALNIFHYSPSIIYATISVLVSYIIIEKLTRIKQVIPRPLLNKNELLQVRWEYITGILIFMILMSMTIQAAGAIVTRSDVNSTDDTTLVIDVDSIESFIKDPSRFVFSESTKIVGLIYDPMLTRVVGSLATYRVSLVLDNALYFGFLEIVDIPARLHTLQLCVTLQGYRVINTWGEDIGSTRVSYLYMEKDGIEYLLTYVLIPIILRTPGGDELIYARLSLTRPVREIGEYSKLVDAIFRSLNRDVSTLGTNTGSNTVFLLGVVGVGLFSVLVIYVASIYISSYLRRFTRM